MISREMARSTGFYIGDLVRACNLNPTMKTIAEIGGEKEKGKKTIGLEDMYPLFKKAKDSKDTGGIHDFVEILKLYDKNSDKTMLSKDLFRLLTNLGEKLSKEEAKGLMNELCDPQQSIQQHAGSYQEDQRTRPGPVSLGSRQAVRVCSPALSSKYEQLPTRPRL